MSKETFQEQRFQALDHSFMLFIEGVEVSQYCVGSIEWGKTGKNGPNTISFGLSNANNAFIMTERNLGGAWAKAHGPYSETVKRKIHARKIKANKNVVDKLTGEPRYPFYVHKPILHHNDRCRLLVKHPYRKNSWYPAFVGFITSYPWDEDYLTGKSNIRIQGEDIRHIMDKMRIRTNALADTSGQLTTPEALFSGEAGIFRDLELNGAFTHILAGLSFPEVMDFLLTGGSTQGLDNNVIRSFGVGQLEEGLLYEVTPGANNTFPVTVKDFTPARDKPKKADSSLEGWNDLCLFGSFEEPLTTQEAIDVGVNTFTGGRWDPAAGKVHFLLPAADTDFTDLIEFGNIKGATEHNRAWQTRLGLIEEVIERMGYEWRVTAIGDIVFEFPMVDFLPQFYGRYESALTVDKHLKNFSMDPESGDLVTALTATGGFAYQEDPRLRVTGPNPQIFFPKTWVVAPILASRVGVRADTISFPHIHDIDLLCQFTLVNYFRKLALANQITAPFVYRLPLEPNRPCFIVPREKMAVIESLNYSLDIESGMGTLTANLTMPRDKRADGTYRFITGGEAAPITYRQFSGIGQLISVSAGLTIKCESGPDVLKFKQEASLDVLKNSGSTRGPVGGLTRDEIREIAKQRNATEEEIVMAIVISSEDPDGPNVAQEAIIHTLLNRVKGNTPDKAPDVWRAAVGKRTSTGKQGGRPYSTERPPTTDALWDKRLATVRSAQAASAAGKDPTNGATRFNHPRGFATMKRANEVDKSWKGKGFKRKVVKIGNSRTNDKRIRVYRYDP